MLHVVRIERAIWRAHDPRLEVESIRGIGFVFVCSCGERGKIRGNVKSARIDGRLHVSPTRE